MEGMVAGATRIPQATGLIAREIGVLGGIGGAAGVGGQALSDLAQHRLSTIGDYVGAALGGGVGGLASMVGRGSYAGAAAGGVTSLAQDALNGRLPSVDRARQAAIAGGAFGAVGGVLGRAWSNGLSNSAKEQLGEKFSRLRTWARGDETMPGPKTREYLDDGGYTVPDQRTYSGDVVESKFGRSARLSRRQDQAYNQPLLNYRIDAALPQDVGVMVGLPASIYGYQASAPDSWD
jgi:hypothetical protein